MMPTATELLSTGRSPNKTNLPSRWQHSLAPGSSDGGWITTHLSMLSPAVAVPAPYHWDRWWRQCGWAAACSAHGPAWSGGSGCSPVPQIPWDDLRLHRRPDQKGTCVLAHLLTLPTSISALYKYLGFAPVAWLGSGIGHCSLTGERSVQILKSALFVPMELPCPESNHWSSLAYGALKGNSSLGSQTKDFHILSHLRLFHAERETGSWIWDLLSAQSIRQNSP